jgi:hypothetical protein
VLIRLRVYTPAYSSFPGLAVCADLSACVLMVMWTNGGKGCV